MVKDNMSEIISKAQAFLHRTPIEPINYTGEIMPEPERNRKWRNRALLAAAGYLAFVSIDNATYYYDTARVSAESEKMLYDVDGCDPFLAVTEDEQKTVNVATKELTEAEKQAIHNIEFNFIDTSSAAKKFEPHKFNPIKFIIDWAEIHKHEQLSFSSDISGLDVHLYSDTSRNPFDFQDQEETVDAIDELIHSSLDKRVEYEHVGVSAYTDCLRDRFIDPAGPRELEGKRLNIYVPSKPGVCFSNGLVQDIPEGAIYEEFCDSIGATKEVRLAVRPFYEYRRNWMVLMTNNKDPENAEKKLSTMFVHEPTHFLMEAAGMPFHYDDNEKLALYLQQEVIQQLYSEGLPRSLSYPDNAYEFDSIQD